MDTVWNRDFFLEFIEIYHKNECLWKMKSKDYYNRRKKNEGYAQLLEKAKSVNPKFTEDDVKKKINNFRSSFRKEYKKVSSDDSYSPKLWYYNNLLFLKDQEDTSTPKRSEEDSEAENSDSEPNEDTRISPLHKRQRTLSQECQELQGSPPLDNMCNILLEEDNTTNLSAQNEDDFDYIGRLIAHRLRELPAEQSQLAEKLINDVISQAQFNNLNIHAYIAIPTVSLDTSASQKDRTSEE